MRTMSRILMQRRGSAAKIEPQENAADRIHCRLRLRRADKDTSVSIETLLLVGEDWRRQILQREHSTVKAHERMVEEEEEEAEEGDATTSSTTETPVPTGNGSGNESGIESDTKEKGDDEFNPKKAWKSVRRACFDSFILRVCMENKQAEDSSS
eukprot:TRINITY_DN82436_c0_g1_i1.p1 TRINITY_DN82436_c0_g1~~TRINITY_DN82436_c0_g1_i1.p1  ORF type:complete len:154 (+),score=52.63 TRINITY_DN82436_c0_g1_i1:163-624(+)